MAHQSDSEQQLLTIAELARSLALPESTTRYYCNRFAAHLPSVGEGRRRRYLPEALETLKTVAQTMRRNKNAFAVDLLFRDQKHAPGGEPAPAPFSLSTATSHPLAGQMLSLLENQTKALRDIADAMHLLAKRLPANAPEDTHHTAAENRERKNPAILEENVVLRDEIATLRSHMRAAETVHQNDLEQLRKWLARLGEALPGKQP